MQICPPLSGSHKEPAIHRADDLIKKHPSRLPITSSMCRGKMQICPPLVKSQKVPARSFYHSDAFSKYSFMIKMSWFMQGGEPSEHIEATWANACNLPTSDLLQAAAAAFNKGSCVLSCQQKQWRQHLPYCNWPAAARRMQ